MVLVQKLLSYQLFFLRNKGQKSIFYDILEQRNAFLGYKNNKLKCRKIDIFPKGLTHGFGPKMTIFSTLFSQAIQGRQMSFTILQNEKTPFQAIKTKSSNSRKIKIFPTGLTHGFCPKMAIFPTFFLGNISQENIFYDILERKNSFLGYKNTTLKKWKN